MSYTGLNGFIKQVNIYDFLISLISSIAIVSATRMVFTGDVFGSIHENYMKPFTPFYFVLFIILIPVCMIVFNLLYRLFLGLLKADDYLAKKSTSTMSPLKKIIMVGIILTIVWVIYYLSFYPGGLFADTIIAINWYQAGILDNHNPLLYTYLVGWCISFGESIGRDMTWSIGFFFALQMIVIGIEVLALLWWEIRRGVSELIQLVSMIYMIFFPLIPLYGASIWKDTPFCMALLFWMIPFCDLCKQLREGYWTKKTIVLNIIGFFLMSFTRNNGFYAICFSAFIIFIVCIRTHIKSFLLFLVIGAISLLSIFIIQNPIFSIAGVASAPRSDGLCIPLQQICAVVAYDGNITEAQRDRLHILAPKDNIKENFIPANADSIRWYSDVDGVYFGSKDFIKLWGELLITNPGIYVDEYLINTAGFWNVNVTSSSAYTNTFSWDQGYAKEHDYFYDITGLSFKSFIEPKRHISGAWFFWIFFVEMFLCMKRFGWRSMVFYSPMIGVWITIMIATFIAASLRFVAPLIFSLPFVFIIPSLLKDNTNCLIGLRKEYEYK